jgi:hypothetical protein
MLRDLGDEEEKIRTALISAKGNVAQSNDGNVSISRIDPNFNGKRFLVGGDTRLEYKNWLITAEAIYGKFKPAGGTEFEPFSYQTTVLVICS